MFRRAIALLAISLSTFIVSCAESGVAEGSKEAAKDVQEGGRKIAQDNGKIENPIEEGAKRGEKATGRAVESGARKTGKAIKQIGGSSRSAADGR